MYRLVTPTSNMYRFYTLLQIYTRTDTPHQVYRLVTRYKSTHVPLTTTSVPFTHLLQIYTCTDNTHQVYRLLLYYTPQHVPFHFEHS